MTVNSPLPPEPCLGRSHRNERGIALILVLVILPLVAIIMVQLNFETTIGERLADNILTNQQFKQAIAARRRQMQQRLVRDLINDQEGAQQGGAYDHYGDIWGPDSEGGGTTLVVTKGDEEKGDQIQLYTEIYDEQAKFNLNLLRHSDAKTRTRAAGILRRLLELYRDPRFGDVADNDYKLDGAQAQELAEAMVKFVQGDERDERVRQSEMPNPTPEMKQGVFTIRDLEFCHRLMREKRVLETFKDVGSGQTLPSLADFVTVYGDARINANTAPIQLIRALFPEPDGQGTAAEEIFHGRGGYLNTDEDLQRQEDNQEERDRLEQEGNEEALEEMANAYQTVNDISNLDMMKNQAFLRRNEVEVARDFTVRSNFYTLIVTARRDSFVRQHRVVLERHLEGVETWESEIRTADASMLPGDAPAEGPSGGE